MRSDSTYPACVYPARLPDLLDAKGLHHSRGVTGRLVAGDKLLLIRLRSRGRQTGLIEFHASSVFGDVARRVNHGRYNGNRMWEFSKLRERGEGDV